MDKYSYSKELKNRLSRNLGHMAKLKQMVDDDEDFEKVIMQMTAVRSAINGTTDAFIMEKLTRELDKAIEAGDAEAVRAFYRENAKYF